jgi:ribonuclease VapC
MDFRADSSAILAIVFNEPDHSLYLNAMLEARALTISAATVFECRLVSLRKAGEIQESKLIAFLASFEIDIAHFDETQVEVAVDAFRRYGKGCDKAALNFGDCFSYALAKSRGEPLLYKGGDFARTDMAAAV